MKKIFFLTLFTIFFLANFCLAAEIDTDGDGVSDYDEINVYHTNPNNLDTDGDGYSDGQELKSGFSPWEKTSKKMEETDFDHDGLSDRMELNFHTDPTKADTDGDGYSDGQEIKTGYNPLNPAPEKLAKKIEVNLAKQKLAYFLGGVRLGEFLISSGTKVMPTPKGTFQIANKNIKAWSSYGLWMPYWLGLRGQNFGLHELPYWPSGIREGESHLGHPASHGCVRLGRHGEAKTIYDWAEIGTPVIIY